MKKWFRLGMAVFAAGILSLVTGCGEKGPEKLKIGVSIPAATHGWAGGVVYHAEQCRADLMKQNPDLEIFVTTGSTTAEQNDRVENLLARKLDALVVMCQEPAQISQVCKIAKQQGVYLAVVSNPLPEPVQDVFLNGDNRGFGRAAAEAMGKLLNGKGDIVIMEGIPCPINSERVGGFREVLAEKYPGIRVLASQSANWNTEKGLALMENYLQKFSKIDGVWAGDDDVLTGALKAVEESGRKDIQVMIGGGGSKSMVKRVMDRDRLVKATVTYPPAMIRAAMETAVKALRNNRQTEQKEIVVPSEIVLPENAEAHYYPDSVY